MNSAERSFRRLLSMLPQAFRREAESELLDVFRDGYAKATVFGRLGRLRFWIRTVADLVTTAAAEHWETRRQAVGAKPFRRSGSAGSWFGDLRHALRKLGRHPLHASISALTLGIGVAAMLVVTALVKSILVDPLPYHQPEELVRLVEIDENGRPWWPSYPNLRDWRDHADFLDGVAGVGIPESHPVITGNRAIQARVGRLMRGALATFGVTPIVGRSFSPTENAPGGPPVALVSFSFWRNELAQSDLGNLQLTIETDAYQVIGVLPADFRLVGDGGALTEAAVWLPMERSTELGGRRSHGYHAVGRLAPNASLEETRAAMNQLATRLRENHGEPTAAFTVQISSLEDYIVRDIRRPLQLLLAGSIVVLLVACFNLSAKILADGLGRRRELSVRLALGAHRRALFRQLLIESGVLAIPVAMVGITIATGVLAFLRHSALGVIPRLDTVGIDTVTVVATVVITTVSAVAAGIIPAVTLSATSVAARLRTRGGGNAVHRNLWHIFVIVQVSLTMLLLFGSGILIRSFQATVSAPIGYDPRSVLSVSVNLPPSEYPDHTGQRRYLETALQRIRTIPGVSAVGMTNVLPHETTARISQTYKAGVPNAEQRFFAGLRVVDPGMFAALQIPILAGETSLLTALAANQAVIDQALADKIWGHDVSPLGLLIHNGQSESDLTVVGTVGSIREWDYEMGLIGAIYVDYRTFDQPELLSRMHILVRTAGDTESLIRPLGTLLNNLDPLVPTSIESLRTQIGTTLGGRRLLLGVSSAFGFITLLLATVGVYSIVAFTARQQQREMGIRIALGAGLGRVRVEMIRTGMVPVIAGVLVGAVALVPVGRAMSSQIVEIAPFDPLTIFTSVGVLVGGALLAADVPARRATRLDPVGILDDG